MGSADTRAALSTRVKPVTEHFLALDALRGVAAVAVLCLHWCEGLGNPWFGGARLAVDFFFLLSGFVMDHAYTERLATELSFRRFFLIRVIRLWPMIAAGALIGLAREAMRGVISHDPTFSLPHALFQFGLNLFMIPDLWSGLDAYHYPLNIAMWSLFAEFVAYVLFGWFTYKAGTRVLVALAAVSGLVVAAWLIWYYGNVQTGPYIPGVSYPVDICRAIFSFTIGMLLYRLRDRLPALPLGPWVCAAVLFAMMAVPEGRITLPVRALVLIGLFPVLVLAGARAEVTGKTARAASRLGDLSYPLYAVHTPLIWLLGGALSIVLAKAHIDIPKIWLGIIVLPITAVIAYFLLRFYDEPLRRYFGRLYRRAMSPKTAS